MREAGWETKGQVKCYGAAVERGSFRGSRMGEDEKREGEKERQRDEIEGERRR